MVELEQKYNFKEIYIYLFIFCNSEDADFDALLDSLCDTPLQ